MKDLLNYDPETGVITWVKPSSTKLKPGDIAGSDTGNGYRRVFVNGRKYLAHRLAWYLHYGVWPSKNIDHINGDPSDNRIENLRDVSQSVNIRNQGRLAGVTWNKALKKWEVALTVDYRKIYLGVFDDWFDAVCARKSAETLL